MESTPPWMQELSIRVGDTTLRYVEAGGGPPLLLIPGNGRPASDCNRVLPGLAAEHRVIAVAFPGHGDSDGRKGRSDTLAGPAELADLLWRFAEWRGSP
ncbi:hypothetical protein Sfulv_58870 [Streptomyces fulvorobeus]|uniref:Alpha/beta hydrolase n=1 Tax=Streptomyces fulvorobeus TaxID=284028 RepID=A0A7J0CH85_9ACTN|nr:hypothetical protein Sfulv_58870 [Streptomyces fulvorobeus]